MTGQDAEPLLQQYLQDNDDQTLDQLAGLARHSSLAAQQLVQIVEDAPDAEVQAAALRALGAADPALLIAPLGNMLRSEGTYSDYTTRATAAYLAGLYQVAGLKDALENCLRSDQSADVRYWSAVALGELGDETSLPVLEGAKGDGGWADNQQTVGSAAAQAILKIDQRNNL